MTQDNRTDQEKKKRKRKRKSKQTLTRAVPHIRLSDTNIGKLEALDQLASAFMALTQQYVTLFCTQQDSPDGYAEPIIATDLSERWQRVAIQQAAGIAKSWRTNRQNAYSTYLKDHAAWKEAKEKNPASRRIEPVWREWNRPELRVPSLQANINVVKLEASEDSTFDCWLVVASARERPSAAHPRQARSLSQKRAQRSHPQHLGGFAQTPGSLVAHRVLR